MSSMATARHGTLGRRPCSRGRGKASTRRRAEKRVLEVTIFGTRGKQFSTRGVRCLKQAVANPMDKGHMRRLTSMDKRFKETMIADLTRSTGPPLQGVSN